MIYIFSKELIKTGLGFAAGLIFAFVTAGTSGSIGFYFLCAFYVLGLVYGITIVGPWMLSLVSSALKYSVTSIIFKSLLGFILIIIALPIGIAVLLTIGCIIGLFYCIRNLVMTFPGLPQNTGFRSGKNRKWNNGTGLDWGDFQPNNQLEDNGSFSNDDLLF